MLNAFFLLLARLSLSLIFLISGFNQLLNWYGSEKMLITALSDWQGHIGSFMLIQNGLTFLVSRSSPLLAVGIALEILGGLMILTGFKDRLGAVFLILFLIPSTLLFHDFWFLEDAVRELQVTMFLKNLALIGSLVFVANHGVHGAKKNEGHHSYMGLS